METSLHRELKSFYAGEDARFEVPVGKYRIDAVSGGRLIEIQHGSLAAIRDKVRNLLEDHQVLVVKPIVVHKLLVKRSAEGGRVIGRRMSPKRGRLLDLFEDLVHFTRVFPHHRLTLEVPLVDIEEWRYPGHGRRRRWHRNDHQIEDQRLVTVRETHRLRTCWDLWKTFSCPLPREFHTGHLAESLAVDRWIAQRIAYCLREMGAVRQVGKQGNAQLYALVGPKGDRKAAPPKPAG
ncbi:MAG TPA: hypothetical protein VMY42_23315 [Thermoguttaceae bacterium]|nr:hypothetical protein [Thermoguttaceae bacterium]